MSYRFAIIIFLFFGCIYSKNREVNVVGYVNFKDGIGKVAHAIADVLHTRASVTLVTSNTPVFGKDCAHLQAIYQHNLNPKAKINIFASLNEIKQYPNLSQKINIAYSMIEGTAIPKAWTQTLNKYFDLVAVPDSNLIDVYVNSGVKIPVYALPLPVYLEDFLANDPNDLPSGKFVFGSSAGFGFGKNQTFLVEAFHKAFNNNPNVLLKIHGRHSFGDELDKTKLFIVNNQVTNIEIIEKIFSEEEYLNFYKALDCYVLLSKGEGFSITPREALSLGIPCILSYVGAHKTICDAGVALGVPFTIPVISPFYIAMFNDACGYQFTGKIDDGVYAFKKMYENYDFYKIKAMVGKQWVRKYLRGSLVNDYSTLINPKNISLGKQNKIHNGVLETNSKKLFLKYSAMIKKTN